MKDDPHPDQYPLLHAPSENRFCHGASPSSRNLLQRRRSRRLPEGGGKRAGGGPSTKRTRDHHPWTLYGFKSGRSGQKNQGGDAGSILKNDRVGRPVQTKGDRFPSRIREVEIRWRCWPLVWEQSP